MPRAADKLIDQIVNDIFTGALRPGDHLEESILAERFKVSRTPIREAIRALVDNGLVETRPRRGAYVRSLNPTELLEMFEVAAELEGMACRLAATAMTESDAIAICHAEQNCRKAANENDIQEYGRMNEAFHAAIHAASGNAYLIKQLQTVETQLQFYRSMPYEIRGRLEKSADEHEEIAKAILAGNAQEADSLMRDHMMLQGQRLPALIKML